MGKRNRNLDYYLDWRIGPVALRVVAALFALWLTGIHWNYPQFPSWAPALIGLIVAAVIRSSSNRVDLPHLPYGLAVEERKRLARIGNFRAACWLLTGAWATWTMVDSYQHFAVGGLALAVGTGVAIELGNKIDPRKPGHDDEQQQTAAAGTAADEPGGLGTELAPDVVDGGPLFAKQLATALTIKGVAGNGVPVSVRRVKKWPNETGHTWSVGAPFGSELSFAKLRGVVGELGPMLQWPVGCPITAKIGSTHQAETLLDMCVRNGMMGNYQFPRDYRPRSILNPFGIGYHMDMTRAMLSMYRDVGLVSGLIGGKTGSGKTVALHDITGNLVLCRDAIVIHVDLNGGSLGAQWTRPFANGLIQRPAVDFVASGPADALWVAEWANDIAEMRKSRINELMYGHDDDVLLPGNGVHSCAQNCGKVHPPAIVIIVDEAAEVAGDDARGMALAATAALRAVQRKGRAMGVMVVWSALRGVAEVVPTAVKAMATFVLAGLVRNDDELAYLLDWNNGVTVNNLVTPGLFYYRPDVGAPIQMIKLDGLKPTQIGEISIAAEEHRPIVPANEAIHGWDQRWSRPEAAKYLMNLRSGAVLDGESDPDEHSGGTIVVTDRRRPPVDDIPPADDYDGDYGSGDEDDQLAVDLGMSLKEMEAWFGGDETIHPLGDGELGADGGEQQPDASTVGSGSKDRGARFAFIVELLAEAGLKGMKKQDITNAVLARFPKIVRKRTVSDDLTAMRKSKMVAKHPDPNIYATWVLWGYNQADDPDADEPDAGE